LGNARPGGKLGGKFELERRSLALPKRKPKKDIQKNQDGEWEGGGKTKNWGNTHRRKADGGGKGEKEFAGQFRQSGQ